MIKNYFIENRPKIKLVWVKYAKAKRLFDWNFPYRPNEVNWKLFKEGSQLISVVRYSDYLGNKGLMHNSIMRLDELNIFPLLKAETFLP